MTRQIVHATLLAALAALPAAAEQRSRGAHVHGIATVNVAVEGGTFVVMLETPAANVTGFEHAPGSDAERELVARAASRLGSGEAFTPDPDAGCELETAEVEGALLGDVAEYEHDDNDHAHGDDHVHDDGRGAQAHADFEAVLTWNCTRPEALATVRINLFEMFDGFDTITVNVAAPAGQIRMEATAASPTVSF